MGPLQADLCIYQLKTAFSCESRDSQSSSLTRRSCFSKESTKTHCEVWEWAVQTSTSTAGPKNSEYFHSST